MATQIEAFTGQERFAAPPARILATLSDPEALARAIPGLVSHERHDDRTLRGTIRPGFSFMRASMRMVLTIAESAPPADARPGRVLMRIESQGIGASMNVSCRIEVHEESDGASRVTWEATVHELSGLITAVSPALIRGAAGKVIRDGWEAIRRQVEPG